MRRSLRVRHRTPFRSSRPLVHSRNTHTQTERPFGFARRVVKHAPTPPPGWRAPPLRAHTRPHTRRKATTPQGNPLSAELTLDRPRARRKATTPHGNHATNGKRTTYPYVARRARRARTSRSARNAPMRHASGAHTPPSSRSSLAPNPVSVVTDAESQFGGHFVVSPRRDHALRRRVIPIDNGAPAPWLAPPVTHASHAWGSQPIYIQ